MEGLASPQGSLYAKSYVVNDVLSMDCRTLLHIVGRCLEEIDLVLMKKLISKMRERFISIELTVY